MAHQGLRSEHLDALRARAHDYFKRVNRPVPTFEVASVLFERERASHSVSSLMVRTLLSKDERFMEARDELWELADSPYRDLCLSDACFAVVDLEATGSRPHEDRIIEVGIVRIEGLRVTQSFQSLVNPMIPIPKWIRSLTGIHESMLQDAPRFHQLVPRIMDLVEGAIFVAHNVDFDYPFLRHRLRAAAVDPRPWPKLCTVQLSRHRHPELGSFSLGSVAEHFDVPLRTHHRAVEDATAAAHILLRQLTDMRAEGVETVGELLSLGVSGR